jgi:archaetidylinositol phosphate synthase
MLGYYFRKHLVKMDPVVKLCAKTRISPSWISILSLLPALLAGGLIIRKFYLLAGLLAAASLFLDILDGACARENSQESKLGDYIDALADRYREFIFYFGFALAGFPLEAFLAFSGCALVSFAKARTALCVAIDDHDWPAIGDMADRNLILIGGVVPARVKPVWFGKYNFLSFILVGIALLTHLGCFYRMNYAKKLIQGVASPRGKNK